MAWLVALAFVVAVAGTAINAARRRKRDRVKIERGFGEVPDGSTGLRQAEAYWRRFEAERHPQNAVDALTWENLDMDAVFSRVNACQSEAGDMRLYQLLHLPLAGETKPGRAESIRAAREARLHFLAQHAQTRLGVQFALHEIGRPGNGTLQTLVFENALLDEKYKAAIYLLAALPLAVLPLFFVSASTGAVCLLLALLVNFVSSYLFKSRTGSYGAVFPLARVIRRAGKLAKLVHTYDPALAKELEQCCAALHAVHLPLMVMDASDMLLVQSMPDLTGLFQLPMLCYFRALHVMRAQGGAIERLYGCVGDADVDCCVLSFRASLAGWCAPSFAAGGGLAAKDVYHPLLAQPVCNSIAAERGVLLTGSNASGKSTFIKTLAVNCILAQTVNTCCAASFAMRPGGVVTAMGIEDDIVEGDSYFVAEIKALRRMLLSLGGVFQYFFIDEILKGTNTVERIGASKALLRHLAGKNCLCFAATHDIELVELTAGLYDMYHFSENVDDAAVTFGYRLQKGPVQTRNALKLLEVFRFPPEVVDSARQAVAAYEELQKWT